MKFTVKQIVTMLQQKKFLTIVTVILSFPAVLNLIDLIQKGALSFWDDPARDLLNASTNLQNPTLIGPPSGIPGVFYGPYWIWFLSLAQLISFDPRVVTFLVATLPYLIIFPVILYQYRSVFSLPMLVLLWLFFLYSSSNYFTDLWNPHPAVLILLIIIYLLLQISRNVTKKNLFTIICAGLFTGLLMNFHLSFGIAAMLGIIVYYLVYLGYGVYQTKKKKRLLVEAILQLSLLILGIIISFLPFIVFELRHQFLQTKTLLDAFLHYGGVVDLAGFSKEEIVNNFFGRGAKLLSLPVGFFAFLFTALVVIYSKQLKKQWIEKKLEMKLLIILVIISGTVLTIYITANNPIWDYHFIGVELIFLLALGLLVDKFKWAKVSLFLWLVLIIVQHVVAFAHGVFIDPKNYSGNLASKQAIVEKIYADADSEDYVVYANNASIYLYDYAYLFKIMANKHVSYDPGNNPPNPEVIYLILPKNSPNQKDFITFRGQAAKYHTIQDTLMPDGTRIIKRVRNTAEN